MLLLLHAPHPEAQVKHEGSLFTARLVDHRISCGMAPGGTEGFQQQVYPRQSLEVHPMSNSDAVPSPCCIARPRRWLRK